MERNGTTDRFALYLMNQKGFHVLSRLIDHDFQANIAFVVTGRDRNVEDDFSQQITTLCRQHQIPIYARQDQIPANNGYQLAIGWRWLLPEMEKLIVIHDSLLPRYRGFAPLVNSLINGEKRIGATAIFASEQVDQGPIIAQGARDIEYPIKISTAIDQMSEVYWEITEAIFTRIRNGAPIQATPQNEEDASFSVWLDDDDYRIDWTWNASRIQRFVDAKGSPYRGASTLLDDTIMRVHDVTQLPDLRLENRHVGKVMSMDENRPVVICGSGLLRIDRLSDDTGQDVLPLKRFRCRFR